MKREKRLISILILLCLETRAVRGKPEILSFPYCYGIPFSFPLSEKFLFFFSFCCFFKKALSLGFLKVKVIFNQSIVYFIHDEELTWVAVFRDVLDVSSFYLSCEYLIKS